MAAPAFISVLELTSCVLLSALCKSNNFFTSFCSAKAGLAGISL